MIDLDFWARQGVVVLLFALAIWGTFVTGVAIPGHLHRKAREDDAKALADSEIRSKRWEDRCTAAEASNRALELMAESLRAERARGDELKALLHEATVTARQATLVADVAQQRLNSGGGTGGAG